MGPARLQELVREAERRERILMIIGITIGSAIVLSFVLSLVIHSVLLRTDRFDWLEAPKRTSQLWSTRPVDAQAAPSR